MRHRKVGKKLDRASDVRRRLRRQLAINLIRHGQMRTTTARAAELRRFVERLVSLSRTPTLAHRREILQHLNDPNATDQLLTTLGPKYKDQPGGYTRTVSLGQRQGDGAKMVMIMFVEKL